jgi:hypothetical protein
MNPGLGSTWPLVEIFKVLFPYVTLPKLEADHSPPSTAEAMDAWMYISIPPYVFMTGSLIKHRYKFS